jgi:hypothetical protein
MAGFPIKNSGVRDRDPLLGTVLYIYTYMKAWRGEADTEDNLHRKKGRLGIELREQSIITDLNL